MPAIVSTLNSIKPRTSKKSAMRMDKALNVSTGHKQRVDAPKAANMHQMLASNLLERHLGIPDFGRYVRGDHPQESAFTRVDANFHPETEPDSEDELEEAISLREQCLDTEASSNCCRSQQGIGVRRKKKGSKPTEQTIHDSPTH